MQIYVKHLHLNNTACFKMCFFVIDVKYLTDSKQCINPSVHIYTNNFFKIIYDYLHSVQSLFISYRFLQLYSKLYLSKVRNYLILQVHLREALTMTALTFVQQRSRISFHTTFTILSICLVLAEDVFVFFGLPGFKHLNETDHSILISWDALEYGDVLIQTVSYYDINT